MKEPFAPALERLKRLGLPWLAVWLVPIVVLGPALLSGRVLFWGTPMLQFIPWRQYGFALVREGVTPLWNPLLGMGAPLLANLQSALLYPPNWLHLLSDSVWLYGLLVLIHWGWAGTGMAALSRRLGHPRWAAAIAGMAYGASGYVIARSAFLSINAAVAWTPWLVWALESLRQTEAESRLDRRAMVQLSLVVAMLLLAGHAQTAWYSLLLAGGWWVVRTDWRSPDRAKWSASARAMIAVLVGVGLAAAQLVPTWEYLQQSQRAASLDPASAMTYSFWPPRGLELLFHGVFGHPRAGDFWGYGNYWEDAIYIGVLPLLLAVTAGVNALRGRGDHPRLGRWLLLFAGTGLLLGLGGNTPVFPWLFESVPTFGLFQAPTRWNLLLVFSLSLLAAEGAVQLGTPRGRSLYWTRLGTAGAAAIVLVALVTWWRIPAPQSFVGAIGLGGVWLLCGGLLQLTRHRLPPSGWIGLALVVVVLDLSLANTGALPTTDADIFEAQPLTQTLQPGSQRLYMGARAEHLLKFYDYFRFDSFNAIQDWRAVRASGVPNTPVLERVASANNFDPLVPGRFANFVDMLEAQPLRQQRRLWQFMNVGQAAMELGDDGAPIYQSVPNGSRARIVIAARQVSQPEQALGQLADPALDTSSEVVIESSAPLPQLNGGGRVLALRQATPLRIEVDVEMSGEGWLVLSDIYYPGWTASVDGVAAEILPANAAFRAVRLPAEATKVVFEYRPSSWILGLILTGLSLFTLAAVAAIRTGE